MLLTDVTDNCFHNARWDGSLRTWADLAYYKFTLKTYTSKKKEAMAYAVPAVTSIPQLNLEYRSIILEVYNQL